nr:MAG TPA: hypothetical protein [Caudoviricetes sp.]
MKHITTNFQLLSIVIAIFNLGANNSPSNDHIFFVTIS